jgi:putative ABC transport system permease protein
MLAQIRRRSASRVYALLFLYRARLRVHAVQELLSGLGVAVAVALLFATLVANGSVADSTDRVVRAVIGPAEFQLRARGGDGFSEGIARTVKHLPGVAQAAPLLERTATVERADGRRTIVDVAGTDPSLALLNGLAHTIPFATFSQGGFGLSETAASALGIPRSWGNGAHVVNLSVRGHRTSMKLSAVLGHEAFGALSDAAVAVMPLGELQTLAGLRRRVSRVLVQAERGREATVHHELESLAGGHLILAPADQDERVLRQTLGPSTQASTVFAAISTLIGFLFAFNAMLLTVPERRQVIANLRLDGTRPRAIVQMVLFQALLLGFVASAVGLVAGYGLSRTLFHQSPGYLAQAFTLGTGTVIGSTPVFLALAGGIVATVLASLTPLLDLRPKRARNALYLEDGDPGNVLAARVQRCLFAVALVSLLVAIALFVFAPDAVIVASVLLATVTVLSVPVTLELVLRLAVACARRREQLTLLPVAVNTLRATTLRSVALAATGALALFGSIALGGARSDLLRGIDRFTSHYVGAADVWIVNPRDNQAVNDFAPDGLTAKIARVPGVARVESYQGGFLDVGDRRVWVIAWPSDVPPRLLEKQVLGGHFSQVTARLREGGWITVSQQLASARGAGVGDALTLATPSGARTFRIAATTTNLGWSPGAIVIDRSDYARAWQTNAPTALGVDVTGRGSANGVRSAIADTLGTASGLEVLSSRQRAAIIDNSASEGLAQLADITTLLLLATILAMLAALGSSIWQQRVSLAARRLEGARRGQLRRLLLIQVLLMLAAGCVTGAAAGIFGEVAIDGYVIHVTGFPIAGSLVGQRTFEIILLIVFAVLVVAIIPGWIVSRVPPELALAED